MKCAYCKKEFKPRIKSQRYCSQRCVYNRQNIKSKGYKPFSDGITEENSTWIKYLKKMYKDPREQKKAIKNYLQLTKRHYIYD